MSQAVTELVIDADTSGADQYVSAMDRAADAAGKATGANANFILAVAGVGAGVVTAIAAIKEGVDYVVDFNKQLADMATMAGRVGLSLRDMQAIQFGGQIEGLSDKQVNDGLQKSAELLNDASRNANSLSKIFDENGLSVKNVNGQLITENQLLGIAADLVSRAKNPQDAIAIAQMLGFTKEWVPLLQQGSSAIAGLGDEATKAGAIIDDATIQKASEFDAEWRKSSVEFATNMKAAISSVMPMVDDLIVRASQFLKTISRQDVQNFADKGLDQLSQATGLPEGNQAGGIKIDADAFLSGMRQMLDAPAFSEEGWRSFGRAFSEGVKLLGPADAIFATGTDPVSTADFADAKAKYQQLAPWSLPNLNVTASDFSGKPDPTKIPSRDVAGDAVDRAINTLRKHTEQQIADTAAIGQGDAALAGFRATAAETAAVQANQGKETDAQKLKFAELKQQAIEAADALARAKVASQIDFGSKTALLSQSDVAIATQLKGIYGNDVKAALDSDYASALRLSDGLRQTTSAIENNLVSGLTDITTGATSFSQGAQNMGVAFAKTIDQMIIKILVVEPLLRQLQALVQASGILSFGAPGVDASGAINGAIGPTSINGAQLVGLHSGGIVGAEATFKRYVHPSYFDSAPRMHSGGIAGDEVPIIARRGEGVFTEGQMAALGRMGGQMPQINVSLIESPNAQGTVTQRRNSNGGLDIEIAIAQIAAKSAATPGAPVNRVLTDQFSGSQKLAGR